MWKRILLNVKRKFLKYRNDVLIDAKWIWFYKSCLGSRLHQTGINRRDAVRHPWITFRTAQVRKGQVHEGLTALFNTSNYALAILSESNARIVRQNNIFSIVTRHYKTITGYEKFYYFNLTNLNRNMERESSRINVRNLSNLIVRLQMVNY